MNLYWICRSVIRVGCLTMNAKVEYRWRKMIRWYNATAQRERQHVAYLEARRQGKSIEEAMKVYD